MRWVLIISVFGLLTWWMSGPSDDEQPTAEEAQHASSSDGNQAAHQSLAQVTELFKQGAHNQALEGIQQLLITRPESEHGAIKELQIKILNQIGHKRSALTHEYDASSSHERREAIWKEIEELNKKVLHRSAKTEAENLGIAFHVIEHGETLGEVAQKYKTSLDLIVWLNDIENPHVIRPGTRLKILALDDTYLFISKTKFMMELRLRDQLFMRFPIGIAREDEITPEGHFTIGKNKTLHPVWYPRGGKPVPYENKDDNPLGEAWLPFEELPHYGIHGTNEPESIGKKSSAGCIRMRNDDILKVYALTPPGSRVTITS